MPAEFRSFQLKKLSLETGNKWEEKTIFGPIEFDHKSVRSDSLKTEARFGTMLFNKKMLYAFGHFTLKKTIMVTFIQGLLIFLKNLIDFQESVEIFQEVGFILGRQTYRASVSKIIG